MDRLPIGYRTIRGLVRLLMAAFYRKVDVAGLARVPAEGPLIVAANHHNSMVDAMVLLARLPRPLRPLAAAPLFRNPVVAPFLRRLGTLPVVRRQDAGEDPAQRAALFEHTTAALCRGEAILIFPEGRTQPEPVLLELRTGAARMLLAAQEAGSAPVTLLPVGLLFERPGTFREGRALAQVGAPVSTEGLPAAPDEAVRTLTARLDQALRDLIVEAPDRETLHLVGLVEALASAQETEGLEARIGRLRRAMGAYRHLAVHEPERLAAFRAQVRAFAATQDALGLGPTELPGPASLPFVPVLRESLLLLAGLPFALAGLVLHGVPFLLTDAALRFIPHTDEEEATDKIVAGTVFYPLAWALEGWLAWRLGHGPGLAALLLALLPVGLFTLAWAARLGKGLRYLRAHARLRRDPGLPARALEQRRELEFELDRLVARVPAEVLALLPSSGA